MYYLNTCHYKHTNVIVSLPISNKISQIVSDNIIKQDYVNFANIEKINYKVWIWINSDI